MFQKKIFTSLFFIYFFSLFFSLVSICAKNKSEKIVHLIDSLGKKAHVSLHAVHVDTKKVFFSYRPEQPLHIASLNKLFTSYTALDTLGPMATFTTKLYVQKKNWPIQSNFYGDLLIQGGGDPFLVSERMWMLINDLYKKGVCHIHDLILDKSYFDSEEVPRTRSKNFKDQAYNAKISSLSFNFNSATIVVGPTVVGKKARVISDPDNSYVHIINHVQTVSESQQGHLDVRRITDTKESLSDSDTFVVEGTIAAGSEEKTFYRNITNPTQYFGSAFTAFLKQNNCSIDGHIKVVSDDAIDMSSMVEVLAFDSIPLYQIIDKMNKYSNNFMADSLVKKLGVFAFPSKKEKNIQSGVEVIEKSLEKIGLHKGSYQIFDGSGLTRNTHVSAEHIVELLVAAYHNFSFNSEFISSLAVSEGEGTLADRFVESPLNKHLRAKTGSMDGVSAIAGYLDTPHGVIAFALIINKEGLDQSQLKPVLDQMLESLFLLLS